jgi:hypothetical protein
MTDMHPDLVDGFGRMIEVIKKDSRCKGAWHYGSNSRGESDAYSDYDPVFLVSGQHFEAFSLDVKTFVHAACDELLISWAEDYNSEYFKNFCNLIRIKENLHQLDFFILNADAVENWWCRQHLKGCTRENLIFDRDGETGALLDRGLRTDNYLPNPERCFETYWFHVEMLIKYFKRGDIFKILKNLDFLFHSHVDLLISQYDRLDWGAWETKVKKCLPIEKQARLLEYYAKAELGNYREVVKKCMRAFDEDAREVYAKKSLEYPTRIADLVMEYFEREVREG